MYYYEKDFATEIEDMVMDFLAYRKSKKTQKTPEYKIQDYEIGKGWPHYKDFQLSIEQLAEPTDNSEKKSALPELKEFITGQDAYQKQSAPTQTIKSLPYPKDYSSETLDKELTFFHRHYGELCKCLHVHVKEVIKEYEYPGSLIYDEHINKEAMTLIVDKVLNKILTSAEEIEKITQLSEKTKWSKYNLLCALIEVLILNEIFICRRSKYRKTSESNWDYLEYI